jgi:hypothetical protein
LRFWKKERNVPYTSAVNQRSAVLAVLVVAIVAALVYANSLGHGFVVDDLHQVVENPRITSLSNLPAIFSEGVWDFEGRQSSYYRPGMYVLYAFVHSVFGLSATAFHAANVLLHVVCSVLVLLLAGRFVERGPAVFAAFLFAVHPIHTEPVNWVAGAADLGAAMFALAALVLHSGKAGERPVSRRVAGAAFLAAMLFKEPAVVLPAVLLIHDLLFRPSREPRVWGCRAAPYAAALAVYLALRIPALGGAAPVAAVADLGPLEWATSAFALFLAYVWKTIAPFDVGFWTPFDPPAGIGDPRVIGGLLVGVLFVWVAWTLRRRAPEVTFALVLFTVPLVPALYLRGLNQGITAAFAERYLYLPSAGAVLAAAFALQAIRSRRLAVSLAAAIVVLFGLLTWTRNPVWRDSLALWGDAATRYPDNAIARQNHGFALLHAKRVEQGKAELRAAVALDPTIVDRDLAKGAHYVSVGLWKKAVVTLQGVLAMAPLTAEAHFRLGAAYEGLGWGAAAEEAYRAAGTLDPSNPAPWNNLGVMYAKAGRMREAATAFEAALARAPSDPEIRSNLERAR